MQPSLMTDKSQCHSQVWVDKKEADKSIDRQIMMFKVKSRDIEDMHIWLGLLEQDANRQVLCQTSHEYGHVLWNKTSTDKSCDGQVMKLVKFAGTRRQLSSLVID